MQCTTSAVQRLGDIVSCPRSSAALTLLPPPMDGCHWGLGNAGGGDEVGPGKDDCRPEGRPDSQWVPGISAPAIRSRVDRIQVMM